MDEFSFNLIDRPWIPVVRGDGRSTEVALLELFRQAADLREIADPSPLVTAALHRLCLAVLHRVFGPPDLDAWAKLWERGAFDTQAIEDYLSRWRDRFDLFHAKHPFYQIADYQVAKPNSLSKLAHEMATGNNQTLFDHRSERQSKGMSPATAARLTVAIQSFGIAFGISPTRVRGRNISFTDGTLLRGAVSLVTSDTLFNTLMLNLVRYDARQLPISSSERDAPRWERDTGLTFAQRVPEGYLDLLTWQCRAMRLVPEKSREGDVHVRYVHYGQGEKLDDTSLQEPVFAYKADEKTGWSSLKISRHRQLWRDSTALLNVFEPERFRPCAALRQLQAVQQNWITDIRGPVTLRVYGLTTEAGKAASVLLWRAESLQFSLDLLNSETGIHTVERAVQMAEEAGGALHTAILTMAAEMLKAREDDKPDKDAVTATAAGLTREGHYWAALNEPFADLLSDTRDPEAALQRWHGTVYAAAQEAFDISESAAGTTARAYRARARAGALLRGRLARLLNGEEVSDAA